MVCEIFDCCQFFKDNMKAFPKTAEYIKNKFCFGDNELCTRFRIYKEFGGENIPLDLDHDDAEQVKKALVCCAGSRSTREIDRKGNGDRTGEKPLWGQAHRSCLLKLPVRFTIDKGSLQVIQDPTNQYLAKILAYCELSGKEVLEIGCGKGRITRDLALHAKRVLATDPYADAIGQARTAVIADNVAFMQAPTGVPDLPAERFDMVIYTLSLHHVPVTKMSASLRSAAALLRHNGVIVVVEPGDGGSFTEAKEHFGAGSGDERQAREAAIRAIHALEGWRVAVAIHFQTLFRFDSSEDFLASMLPDYRQQPELFVNNVRSFLAQHLSRDGITLDADRRLFVLRPTEDQSCTSGHTCTRGDAIHA